MTYILHFYNVTSIFSSMNKEVSTSYEHFNDFDVSPPRLQYGLFNINSHSVE